MQNKLTNRDHWKEYWSNYQYEKIPSKVVYNRYLPYIKGKSFIEIGGFPGIHAAYFFKNVCQDVTLLDFYIDRSIVAKFEKTNNLPSNSIQCIESDFFHFENKRAYDIVFSLGFIEHFENTRDVIERHIRLLSEKGYLLIVLPNFRGLNGLVQSLFDRKNLQSHNLKSMDIQKLKEIMQTSGLKKWSVDYTRKPMVWLEPKPGLVHTVGKMLIKGLSYLIKLFPIKGRLFSPFIVVYGQAS